MVQNYIMAKGAEEALKMLTVHEGRARIIAGGTDLVLDLQSGKHQADCLVDITGIPELAEIVWHGDELEIGAAVTHNHASADPLVRQYAHALAKASHSVGSNQIRNLSTIGGNIVNGQPAADSAVALAALGASVEVQSADGTERLPMEKLYAGFGKSTVDSTKSLLTKILVPVANPGEGSGYARLEQRKALALPMVCVAAFLRIKDGAVEMCRIAMAPVGVGPVRAVEAEAYLTGKEASKEAFKEAGRLTLKNAKLRDSLVRGSKEYREEVLPVMAVRSLAEAYEDAVNREKEVEWR